MRQVPAQNNTYTPKNIPTVDKVITTTKLSWEEGTYVIRMFSSLLDIATSAWA